jgi:hypothetical protein
MVGDPATGLRRAIRESEEHVAELVALVAALERDGYFLAAPRARELLAYLRQRLDRARARLMAQRKLLGLAAMSVGRSGPQKARRRQPPAAE